MSSEDSIIMFKNGHLHYPVFKESSDPTFRKIVDRVMEQGEDISYVTDITVGKIRENPKIVYINDMKLVEAEIIQQYTTKSGICIIVQSSAYCHLPNRESVTI